MNSLPFLGIFGPPPLEPLFRLPRIPPRRAKSPPGRKAGPARGRPGEAWRVPQEVLHNHSYNPLIDERMKRSRDLLTRLTDQLLAENGGLTQPKCWFHGFFLDLSIEIFGWGTCSK